MKKLKATIKRWGESFKNIKEIMGIVEGLNRSVIPLIALRSLLHAISPYAAIVLSSMIIDRLKDGEPLIPILRLAGSGVGILFLLAVSAGAADRFYSVQKEACIRLYNTKLGEKSLDMDFPQLESAETLNLREKIQDDNSWGSGLYSVLGQFDRVVQLLISVCTGLFLVIPLFRSSAVMREWKFSLLFFTGIIAVTALAMAFRRYTEKRRFKLMDSAGYMRLIWFLLFDGPNWKAGKDIRIYQAQDLYSRYGDSVFLRFRRQLSEKVSRIDGAGNGVSGASEALIEGAAYLFVALRAAAGALSFGDVVRYAGSIHQFASSLSELMLMIGELGTSAGRFRSSIAFFHIPGILYKGSLPVEKRSDNEYEIEFRNVSFRYPGTQRYALKNLSLRLHIGERLAVVGRNGSGKTTFIKLLCRLYDPTEGEILLNGINIRKYDYREYTGIFSVVFQDFRLFSFSLGQNVAASLVREPEKAVSCLEKAGFGERLKSLKDGLDTPLYRNLNETGVEISGGEAQKIALARALYKDAPFIVLDEPTAALDPIAEYEVYSKFNEIAGGRTAVYISHRLSSCRFCDDIAVFDQGKLIQRGSHDELIQDKQGKYCELWNAQAQFYAEKPRG